MILIKLSLTKKIKLILIWKNLIVLISRGQSHSNKKQFILKMLFVSFSPSVIFCMMFSDRVNLYSSFYKAFHTIIWICFKTWNKKVRYNQQFILTFEKSFTILSHSMVLDCNDQVAKRYQSIDGSAKPFLLFDNNITFWSFF